MGQTSKVFASLNRANVETQTDQELAVSYLELQQLRQQVRIAQCGRAILAPAAHDSPPRKKAP
jgi:hypothetical protein